MILTYRYRIKDNSAKKTLRRKAYACNQVWNYCCAQQHDVQNRYRAGSPRRKWASHFDLTKLCKGVGAELEIHQQSVNAVCRNFTKARDKAMHAPRFRSSFGVKRALGWVPFERQSIQISGNTVTYLGKKYRFWEGNRPLPKNAKGGCFVEDTVGRWYVCFHIEAETLQSRNNAPVGIDLGLRILATLSDGSKIEAPKHYRLHEDKLAIAQRAHNMQRVRRIHAKIKNCRNDFLHKETTKLCRKYAFIAVGNVNAKKLAKTRMAKSVLDAGWSTLRSMLKYKSAGYVEVDECFTTQTCSCCGVIPDSSPKGMGALGISTWECSACGASHDRDVNAALNILTRARSAAGPGEESRCIDRISTMRLGG